jgi:hypothetical protein
MLVALGCVMVQKLKIYVTLSAERNNTLPTFTRYRDIDEK